MCISYFFFFFFSSRRRHTRSDRDWSSDVCSSDLPALLVFHPRSRWPAENQERRRVSGGVRQKRPKWLRRSPETRWLCWCACCKELRRETHRSATDHSHRDRSDWPTARRWG